MTPSLFRHSLEHINDPVDALGRVRSALVPGGLVLITVPNFGCWQARRFARLLVSPRSARATAPLHAESLGRALSAAELEVVSVSTSSSTVGLPGSLQYRAFGRCMFPGGFRLRAVAGLCTLAFPLALALDAATGGGDQLHVVARRPG